MIVQHAAASRGLLRDYIALSKPRIVLLLLFTALAGMFLAAGGVPDGTLVFWVLGGGALAAAGANALNHSLDQDIDSIMDRTHNRPVASGRVGPRHALVFGIVLNVVAFGAMASYVNLICAALTLSATLFYVLVYTRGLKRTTPQNIVIGGAAGAIPPMVGWASVTGGIGLPALYMFAIVFFWTPPHFWALALILRDDYARAGVPMLPVVAGVRETKRAIFAYSLLVLALTLMFIATGAVGWVYLGVAAPLGCLFVALAWRLMRERGVAGARAVFVYSMAYLMLLFSAIAADGLISA